MTRRLLVAAGFAALMIAGAAIVVAQDGPPAGPRWHGPGFGPGHRAGMAGLLLPGLRGLDLTDEQREQLQTLAQSHRAEFQVLAMRIRDARSALMDTTAGDTIDEAAVQARSADLAAAIADAALLRAKVRAEVLNVLTLEQQQQLKDRRAQMEQRRKERQERRLPQNRPRP